MADEISLHTIAKTGWFVNTFAGTRGRGKEARHREQGTGGRVGDREDRGTRGRGDTGGGTGLLPYADYGLLLLNSFLLEF